MNLAVYSIMPQMHHFVKKEEFYLLLVLACIVKNLLFALQQLVFLFFFLLGQWQRLEGFAAQGCCGTVQECRL